MTTELGLIEGNEMEHTGFVNKGNMEITDHGDKKFLSFPLTPSRLKEYEN